MPAITEAAIRDPFIGLAMPTLPNQSAGLCEGVGYCAMSQFLILGANDKTLKFDFLL